MNKGYVKTYRSLLDWEWFDDWKVLKVFLYLTLSCNYEEKSWKGMVIMPGQIVTSYDLLSREIKLSIREIRTALKKLKKTGEVTSEATNQFTIFTVQNWTKYQEEDKQNDKQKDKRKTNQRQTKDKPKTTTKEIKNIIIKKTKAKKDFCGLIPLKLQTDDFKKVWMQWEESRRERKKTLTAKSASMQLTMLEQYPVDQAIEIIRQSIMNDWQGLFPPKNQPKQLPAEHKYGGI